MGKLLISQISGYEKEFSALRDHGHLELMSDVTRLSLLWLLFLLQCGCVFYIRGTVHIKLSHYIKLLKVCTFPSLFTAGLLHNTHIQPSLAGKVQMGKLLRKKTCS